MKQCKCCKREKDLRFGFCFDCADAESIIEEGVDMYDKEIPKQEGMSTSMSKLQHILKLYGLIQFKNN
jgi:predicted ATP-dependent serine protease